MTVRTAETLFLGDAGSIIRAAQEAATATESATGKIAASNQKLGASADAAATKTAAAHDKMVASAEKSNKAFAKWGTAAGIGIVAVAADMAVKVESAGAAIAKAGNTSLAAGKQVEDAFRKIPGTVEYSASKIGDAYASIAGELKVVEGRTLSAAQATTVMKAALDLADASGNDLLPTTEALGKVMLTFHLGASKAAEATDVLFNASKVTGLTIEDFTTLVDKARGRLGALAPSLSETAGFMAELAKQGVAGRLTMGSLGGMFGTLLSQTKPVNKTLEELNVHVFNNKGGFVGLRSVIEQLHPALQKYDEASQMAATKVLFGEKANKQLLEVIHQGPAAFDTATAAVSRHGTAANAAAKEHATLQGKLKATRADAENLAASLGERLIPVFQKVVTAISDSIKWLDKHKDAAKALEIVITTILGAALVDFAVIKVAKFVEGIKAMVSGLAALAAKMTATAGVVAAEDGGIVAANEAAGASFTAMAVTAGAAFAKIGLAVGAAVLAIKGLEGLIQKVTGEQSKVNELLGGNQPGEAEKEGEGWVKRHSGTSGAVSGRGNETVEGQILQFFRSKGFSQIAAAGIAGNVAQESSFNPNAPGGGLFQDIGGRGAGQGASVQKQLEAAYNELRGPYHSVFTAIQKAKSPQEAARIFSEQFERPETATANLPHRESAAGQAYGTQSGSFPGSAGKEEKIHEYLGPNGEVLHETSAQHAHRALMERKAKLEGAYVNPFASATGVRRTATDQGVDFSFGGSLGAVGPGIIEKVKNFQGFGETIVELLTSGTHKGQRVYTGLETGGKGLVHVGQHVRAGQAIAHGYGYGGIETGFANAEGLPITPYAPGEPHHGPGSHPTQGGLAFSKFLASIAKGGSNLQLASGTQSAAEKAEVKRLAVAVAKAKAIQTAFEAHLKALKATHDAAFAKFSTVVEDMGDKMKELASSAAQAWNKLQQTAIGLTHTRAIAAIEGSGNAQTITAERAAEEAEQAREQEDQNAKALVEARKHLKEAKGTGNKEETKKAEEAVVQAEANITKFARQQDIKRREEQEAQEKAGADSAEKIELEALEERTKNYEAMLDNQLAALVVQLSTAKITYAKFAQEVNKLLPPGMAFKPSKEEEAITNPEGWPANPSEWPQWEKEHGAHGGTHKAAAVAAGVAMHFSGPVTLGSTRDAERLSHTLAHKLRFGS